MEFSIIEQLMCHIYSVNVNSWIDGKFRSYHRYEDSGNTSCFYEVSISYPAYIHIVRTMYPTCVCSG